MLTPIIIAIFYTTIFAKISGFNLIINSLKNISLARNFGVSSTFSDIADYNFLYSWFSNDESLFGMVGGIGFEDCKIANFFHGNSGALVALVKKNNKYFIRKVARDQIIISRLIEQYKWLKENQINCLPYVNPVSFLRTKNFSYYEMPYTQGSMDMYDWVHRVSIKKSTRLFSIIIEKIYESHSKNLYSVTTKKMVKEFFNKKIIANIEFTKSHLNEFISLDKFVINGENFSIKEWDFLFDYDFTENMMSGSKLTKIHGDLTLENIVIGVNSDWFLIDPNPSKGFQSSSMDWAKLLQSLNMGYENLSRNSTCNYSKEYIFFVHNLSDRYEALKDYLWTFISKKFNKDELMQIEFQEIIHYLRLLSYKINQNINSGILFFAVTCILIRRFKLKYEIT